MHKACPLSELTPGGPLRLDTAPPAKLAVDGHAYDPITKPLPARR